MSETRTESLLEKAAAGSVEAQSALVDHAVFVGNTGVTRPIEALVAAELWARMAASHGSSFETIRRLASVLMMRAGYERTHGFPEVAASLDAEALTLLDGAADLGDELAGRVLAEASSVLPSAGFELIRSVKEAAA